jgi:hypothetical protein
MMMTLVVVTVSVTVLMAGVPSAAQGETGVSLKEYHKQLDIFKKAFHTVSVEITGQHRDFEKLREQLLSQDDLLDNQRSLIQRLNKKVSTIKGDLSKEKTEREKSDQVEKESRTQSDAQIKDELANVIDDVQELEATVVKLLQAGDLDRCSSDSDCPTSEYFCAAGWCSRLQCGNDNQCPVALPYCYGQTCVECTTDSHCNSSSKPKCYDNICGCHNDLYCNRENEYCEALHSLNSCMSFSGYIFQEDTYCSGNDIASFSTLQEATASGASCIYDSNCDGGTYYSSAGTGTKPSTGNPPSCSWVN